MELTTHHDLRIAVLDTSDVASGGALEHTGDADLLRVVDPTPEQYAELIPHGFLFKPQWLFWTRPVYSTLDAYLDTLRPRMRKSTRHAIRQTESGHRLEVEEAVDPARLDTWFALYERHIASLPRGTLYAAEDLEWFRTHPDQVVGIYLYSGDRMVAGLLCMKVPRHRMLRMTYYACDPDHPDQGTTRYMYVQAGVVAAELGHEVLSAGADPNFYGHDIATGLYLLKRRLGFRADPLWRYEADDPPVLEKVLSLDRCEDPSFCVAYGDYDVRRAPLTGYVLSRTPAPATHPFHAPMLASVVPHHISDRRGDNRPCPDC
ncbi:GNAT family N-acetyltransferase [Streptomyces sp. NPDC047821]|uniref:GNAT family N-acetyltransferase n=1 Tax=Streptomyces sp. NPDC047821 TaxID=3365488 RepID=UPI003714EB03